MADAPVDHDHFRDEIRTFIASEYTPAMRAANMRQAGLFCEPELGRIWQRKLYERGWVAPNWPKEYGGPGWDAKQRHIFEMECAAAGTPAFAVQGLVLVGPALMRYGSQAQKDYFLPRILSGEVYFCQGFSEPGAGSDLASLRTSAVRDGDAYIVNGSKIWTTHAHHANWIFVLVRTSTEAPPHGGISFLLAPMDTPGITVRPIVSISGEHELNQTYFDDARIPVANRVGNENEGWQVTKYLLEFERGGSYAASALSLLESAKHIAASQAGDDDGTLWDDPIFRRRAAELEIDLLALSATEREAIESLGTGANVGDVLAATLKITGTSLYQSAAELCVEALGDYALPDQRESLLLASSAPPIGPDYAARPSAKFLNSRAASIYGGANEVMKNVIARAGMGLKAF